MHFLTSDTNNWSGPVNIWSGPAASGSNRPDCLAAQKINVEPWVIFNLLPNNKILDMTKLKALNFADDKLNIDKITISLLDRVENTKGKCWLPAFFPFSLSVFQNLILWGR